MKHKKYPLFAWLFVFVGFLIGLSTPVKAEIVSKTESEVGIYFEENTPEKKSDLPSTIVNNTKDKLRLPQTGEISSLSHTIIGSIMISGCIVLIKAKKRKEDF